MPAPGLVIIGGSYAGIQMAASARDSGYQGSIHLVSAEPLPGYQRPPLSKTFLAEPSPEYGVALRAEAFYRNKKITLLLGSRVAQIDRAAHYVQFANGEVLPYDRLGLATGARPIRPSLPGVDLAGVLTLRTLEDARRLHGELADQPRVVIVGGGFIGLETAASLRKLGHLVTIVERADRLLARAVSVPLSERLLSEHLDAGVDVLLSEGVVGFEGESGRIRSVITLTGQTLDADIVLMAIGASPRDELARDAGLDCSNGVVVDEYCRTSDPHIVAAGDCAVHRNLHADGDYVRIESVPHATEHGRTAGRTLAGASNEPYAAVPWFWSDQYDIKVQIAGLLHGETSMVRLGDEGSFSIVHMKDNRLQAVESFNDPIQHVAARKLIGKPIGLTTDQIGNLAGLSLVDITEAA